jgi:geranylgeranyl diphosphate synthase type II
MHSFQQLSAQFEEHFSKRHFPDEPASLYDAARYILGVGGKRIRPAAVLMGNELFSDINPDSFEVAKAIELFHNFTLIHDDIMDEAPLRRGLQTVHVKYGNSTALLAGDVMLVAAYEHINRVDTSYIQKIISLFNKTAREVCEGQQLDMEFEKKEKISFDEYLGMITLKTSVLLASSLQLGAILGGAGMGNQHHLYDFGKNLGIAFQVQDDYLDAFGDPEKFGKQAGGDIIANKKTFLMIHAMDVAGDKAKKELLRLRDDKTDEKVAKVLQIFEDCNVGEWAASLKEKYYDIANRHLEDIAVLSSRKTALQQLAEFLLKREV